MNILSILLQITLCLWMYTIGAKDKAGIFATTVGGIVLAITLVITTKR